MEIPREVRGFFNDKGNLKQLPSKLKKKLLIIEFLAEKFETAKEYSGKEVDAILNEYHTFNDAATLRRELIMHNVLDRTPDGRTYWKIENEG